jgi:hypothetical protein
MGEGFIVRKGGAVTEQAATPTITEVSKTETEIVFTITNNDASTAVILWEVDDSSPDANSLELATGVTSSNITVDSLADDTTFIVYATANVTGKIKSEVASESITTDPSIVYTAATGGTTLEYDSGGKRYKSHTFTSDGNFEVTTVGDATDDRNQVDYLIIAGGGSGGGDEVGTGGGGAGGYRTTVGTSGGGASAESKVTVTAQTYSIVIGAGGASVTGNNTRGNSGVNSSALGITSTGGSGGAAETQDALTGGSGGGGNYLSAGSGGNTGAAGLGTSGQGFDGGEGGGGTSPFSSGGGGGAGAVGQNAPSTSVSGAGGAGVANLLRTGSNETRGGGGGGGIRTGGTAGAGGSGGGGAGGVASGTGTAGTANTGGGGGGVADQLVASGAGGSGIVVIRYEIAPSV